MMAVGPGGVFSNAKGTRADPSYLSMKTEHTRKNHRAPITQGKYSALFENEYTKAKSHISSLSLTYRRTTQLLSKNQLPRFPLSCACCCCKPDKPGMLGAHPYPFALLLAVSVVAAAPPRKGFAILGPAPPKLNPPADMEVAEEMLARLEEIVFALSRRSRTLAIWMSNLRVVTSVSLS